MWNMANYMEESIRNVVIIIFDYMELYGILFNGDILDVLCMFVCYANADSAIS